MLNGKPLCIDGYCGLGGWAEGFLAEGWTVIGFDNGSTAPYANGARYPGQLILMDALTIHGSMFRYADCFVMSPPCQDYSYLAMPWSRSPDWVRPDGDGWQVLNSAAAKALRKKWETEGPDNRLFDACFRIQREAIDATRERCRRCGGCIPDQAYVCSACNGEGFTERFIPLIVENVRGAQPWVGRSAWNYGSFHLWGDVPALMPIGGKRKGLGAGKTMADGTGATSWFFQNRADPRDMRKAPDGRWVNPRGEATLEDCTKIGGDWFRDPACHSAHGSRSQARKMASAQIAKIPFEMASHIARIYKPRGK